MFKDGCGFVIYRRDNFNNYLASNDAKSIIACDKLERNAKKATVVFFKVFFKNATVGTEKDHENLNH
jgi:hypothetical protein